MHGRSAKIEFTEIFEGESDALFRFTYIRTSDRELSVEITQESFTRLWQKMASGAKMPNPRAFLYVVARHLIIDWYRRSRSLSLEAISKDSEKLIDPRDDSPEVEISLSSDARRVLQILGGMSESYRDIMIMRFVEDLPPREIAHRLGLTANAVSIRISKGIAELRRLLGIDI